MINASAIALLGYVAWTALLLILLAGQRSSLVFSGQRRANSFSPSGEDVSAFSNRLCRAHANCVESFVWLGGTWLLALTLDLTHITDPLALWALGARLAQSVTHLISIRNRAVLLRFAFMLVQLTIAIWWWWQIARALLSAGA